MTTEQTLVGKQYAPIDNSYSVELNNPDRCPMLAGMHGVPPKLVTIITEQYGTNVNSLGRIKYVTNMVNVEDENGVQSCVLFYKHGLVPEGKTFYEVCQERLKQDRLFTI